MTVAKRWLNKDNPQQAEADFIKAYEEAKSFIEARLASGLLDNHYKRDAVETVMWWKFRERVTRGVVLRVALLYDCFVCLVVLECGICDL